MDMYNELFASPTLSESQLLPTPQLRSPPMHPLLKIAAAINATVLIPSNASLDAIR